MKAKSRILLVVPFLALLGFAAPSAPSVHPVGAHTWDFTEVFSNADGTIQFIELKECCGGANEVGLPGRTLTSNTRSWVIPGGPLTPPTSTKSYLIATAAFAALPGAPTPDAIIPAGMVPFFSTSGDTLSYVPYDSWTFGTVPTDNSSLLRNGSAATNSPTNYAGVSGHVNAVVGVPALPSAALIAMVVVALGLGAAVLMRRSPIA